ncbi:hypothetical protein SLA2020_406470 [Shorea laevis]
MEAVKAAVPLLGPVVNVTISKVTEQLDLAVGFKQELMSFHGTLEMVRGVLRDAEQKCVAGSSGVKLWLEGLRSIAEEADEVMDEISYESLRRKVAAKKLMLKQVSYFFTASNPLAFRLKMANKIKSLNAALDVLNTRATGLGLQVQHRPETTPEPRGIRQTDSLLGEPSGVIGRDGDVQKIVKLLIDSSTQQPLRVVSIVGIAGLGKTTLAKLVRNNEQIQGHFSNIMWICVSDNFDVMRILVQMLESLGEGHRENIINRDAIVQKIKGKLEQKEKPEQEEKPEQKNYLLILDDVWNENRREWEDLRDCLLGLSKMNGNRVLVTTRIQNVATVMGVLPEHVHCLKQLKDDDCWSVIRHRVFGNSPIPSELEELETIGRENAKKCKGVPLVASVIGGILCNNRNKDAWCEVWGSIKEADGVLPVLQLSFNRLPKPALKQCFAFCSIFSKDFVMEKEMLIQLWMAHGFLQPSSEGDKKMEDIGDDYFNYLLSSSFFQDAKTDSYRSVITCKMHDLIHHLAQSVSEPQTLILGNGSQGNITAATRHLNLVSDEGMAAVEIGDDMQKLHTLFSKTDVFHNKPANFKKMRVLSFCGANIRELPAVLRKLKHLRYLDVSKTKIEELPEFITKLYQLQTLRFMDCYCMKRPLEGIGNLVNLRHIYFNSEKLMPAGVGPLTCLQTLKLFVVAEQKGHQIEELRGLSQLKELEITKLKMVRNREEAIIAKLSEKTTIQELALHFHQQINGFCKWPWSTPKYSEYRSEERRKHDEDVLEGLQPHSNLKRLRISNYCGEKCPSWMLGDLDELESMAPLSLSNGAKVQIKDCKNLESIADSRLQELIIDGCYELISIEFGTLARMSLKEICIRSSKLESLPMLTKLPYLRTLCLGFCRELRDIGDGLFASKCPNLEALTIDVCDSLMSMPSLDGLSSLQSVSINRCGLKSIGGSLSTCTSLESLCIRSCGSLESIPSLDGLSSLQSVSIGRCGLKSIGGSLSTCTSLESLCIWGCGSLESIPSLDGLSSLQSITISHCGLKSIGGSLSTCTSLESLSIGFCGSLESIPSLDGLSSLRSISISHCGLKSIGRSLSTCTSLKSLSIESCDSLESVPSLDGLSSLQHISISNCRLKSIRGSLSTCTSLWSLCIRSCGSLESIPSLDGLSSLRNIWISFCGLKSIGGSLSTCTSLVSLCIESCGSLESIPSLDGLSSLQRISISHCGLKSIGGSLSTCTSLVSLCIESCDSLESIPSLDGLSSLQRISISHCGLKSIGGSLSACTSLESLSIKSCDSLESVPSLDGLSSLQNISISHCGLKSIRGSLSACTSLESLSIESCDSLESVPSLDGLSSLQNISISHCGLKSIRGSLSTCTSLENLCIASCANLESIPSLDGLSSLRSIWIKFCGLKSIGGSLSTCTSLESLSIGFCGSLESIPSLDGFSSLQSIRIRHCGLKSIGWSLSTCTSLESLSIEFCGSLELIPSLDGLLSLQSISISHCGLKSIGGSLSTCTSLESLSIESCDSLKSFPSLDGLSSLQSIRIRHCGLKSIVGSLSACTSLESLFIESCDSLEELTICAYDKPLSRPSVDKLKSLKIKIWGCGQLKSIGVSLSNSVCLKNLFIYHCDSLESIPSLDGLFSLETLSIEGCGGLTSLPNGLSSCTALETLKISNCDNLISTSEDLRDLRSLETLSIEGCGGLTSLPNGLSSCTALETLRISNCDNLISTSEDLGDLRSLETLSIEGCGGLTSLPNGLSSCTALETLRISNCDNLISTSEDLRDLRSLETLSIEGCGGLTSLPNGLSSCTALETLRISDCDNLISISEDLRDLRSLVGLEITRCGKLRNIRGLGETLGCLTRLRKLHFGGFSAEEEELEEYPIELEELSLIGWKKLENLPCQIQHLTALRTLRLVGFHGIEALPDWLGNLSSLQSLVISFCSSLRYVKAIQRLSNLKQLLIFECPELRGRCDEESGSEWNNISHIPDISIY